MRVLSLAGLLPPQQNGGADDVVLPIINKYDTPAFYLPDPNPALRMPSSLRRGYQDFANTPVTASTQTAALALDLSEGAAIGAEQAVNGGFDADTDWAKGTGVTIGSGVCTFTSVSSALGIFQDEGDWTGGELIRITLDINTLTEGFFRAKAGGNGDYVSFPASTGTKTIYLIAGSAAAGRIEIRAAGTTTGEIDNVSSRVIAGNHFRQETSADEPTLNLTSGLYGYLGDGTSKHFKTGLNAAASGTIMIACKPSADADVIIGARGASGANPAYIYVKPTTGYLSGSVGNANDSTVVGNVSVVGQNIIAVLRWDGSNVTLQRKVIGGALTTDYGPAAYTGSPVSSQPFYIAGLNNNGTAGNLFAGTVWRALAQQSAYTDAEIAAIANQWSRELAALA